MEHFTLAFNPTIDGAEDNAIAVAQSRVSASRKHKRMDPVGIEGTHCRYVGDVRVVTFDTRPDYGTVSVQVW